MVDDFYIPITQTSPSLMQISSADFREKQRETSIVETIEGSPFALVNNRAYQNLNTSIWSRFLLTILLLLVPLFLLWWYIFKYTKRIYRFSSHIEENRQDLPSAYYGDTQSDELGQLIATYNQLVDTVYQLIHSVKENEKLKNEANYYAMSSQVNPHFMFNTLENIRMYIELEESETASNMLFVLSNFLRYNISLRQESTLLKELEHIEHYLLIYQYRQSHQIKYTFSYQGDVPDIPCPFCMLQPLVENSLKHGMEHLHDMLHIQITVSFQRDIILVSIIDNGQGMPAEKRDQLNRALQQGDPPPNDESGQVGVKNVNSRIRYFYGEDYGLRFDAVEPRGLACRITLPRHRDIL